MATADRKKATFNIADDYLIAIGKVCVQWSTLEGIMEMMIAKLAVCELDEKPVKDHDQPHGLTDALRYSLRDDG